jgi:ActR/RegA family two-component response regulator
MNIGFRKAFLNLFRCLKQSPDPVRRVSLSGYGNAATAIATTLHSVNNIDKNINNNNLLANTSSDNFDLSRQPSFLMHQQDNNGFDKNQCDNKQSINNGVTIIE